MLEYNDLKLKRLIDSEAIYKKIAKWYEDEEIYNFYEKRSLNYDEVKEKYSKRIKDDSDIISYIINYKKTDIGIIEYRLVSDEFKKIYEVNDNNSYELNIFIGELDYHNKGIGKDCIDIICNYLFKEKKASKIVACPTNDNYNANRCLQKCGFERYKIFEKKDLTGNYRICTLMVKNKK